MQCGADNNQQTGQHQIDRCTHLVEGGTFIQLCPFVRETAVNPTRHPGGDESGNKLGGVEYAANRTTGNFGGRENFFAFVLTREVNGCFHHFLRLLGRTDGQSHDGTGTNQEPLLAGQAAFAGQDADTVVLRSLTVSIGGEIKEGLQSGQGRTDEVHQVVAGKSHGQGKGAEEYYNAEDVDAQQVEYFHQDCKSANAGQKDGGAMSINPIRCPSNG